jgi:hypothetical protein
MRIVERDLVQDEVDEHKHQIRHVYGDAKEGKEDLLTEEQILELRFQKVSAGNRR